MDKFKIAEQLERDLITDFLVDNNIKNIKFSGKYAQHDGIYLTTTGEEVMFEIKVRNVASYTYPTTVIEKSKYEYLKKQSGKAYLFVFFTDNKVMIKNVKAGEVKHSTMGAPKTTAGDNTKIEKQFVEFDIKDDILIEYEQERQRKA